MLSDRERVIDGNLVDSMVIADVDAICHKVNRSSYATRSIAGMFDIAQKSSEDMLAACFAIAGIYLWVHDAKVVHSLNSQVFSTLKRLEYKNLFRAV